MKRPPLIKILSLVSMLLPGNYLKTFVYLNGIARPRKAIRSTLTSFYRMDHIYDVLKECKDRYEGKFSILEFGTEDGYSFTKMLYATKYMGMADRVTVHTFDSFEGLPETTIDPRDISFAPDDQPQKGQLKGRYEELEEYCRRHYKNYQIHKGFFNESLTPELLSLFTEQWPILVWMDCNLYTSARTAFERLIPYLPNGCVIYFDDYEYNFGSRFTGEARLVYEVNRGDFGEELELVLDTSLSLGTQRIYRFINKNSNLRHEQLPRVRRWEAVHYRTTDSPLP